MNLIKIEFVAEEIRSLIAACEDEETLLTQYLGRRVQGVKLHGERSMLVNLQSKLGAALEEGMKRQQMEEKAKADLEAKAKSDAAKGSL